MPAFQLLRELDLGNNNLVDISPLQKLTRLEVLDISGENNRIKSYAPLLALKRLRVLTIGKITPEGLQTLQHTFPNVNIKANIINVNSEQWNH